MKFRNFIQDNFLIDHAETGALVPFVFRPIQNKYYDILATDYLEQENFKGARELILKARKEGFTSFILALFCSDMILSDNPVRYLEISYKDDATRQHFRRAKTFIISYFKKKLHIEDDKKIEKIVFKSINEGSEFILNHNNASFYVGTASSRTGERGGTVQGILFSEAAHYQDTPILRASEIIEGTKSMVAVGNGMIFQESTANSFNHFKKAWDQAVLNETDYKPRFFSWREFYSPEEFEQIKLGFSDKSLIPQEYPDTSHEAFLSSGRAFFDISALTWYSNTIVNPPVKRVDINTSINPPFQEHAQGLWKIWVDPIPTQTYLLSCDFATTNDFSAACVLHQKTCEVVATMRGKLDSFELAQNLIAIAKHYNSALIIPEVNGIGLALLDALKSYGYSKIYRRSTQDMVFDTQTEKLGFLTTSSTRPLILGQLQSMISQRSIKIYDKDIIEELFSFVYNTRTNKPEAITGQHDDFVFALALVAQAYQEVIPNLVVDETNRQLYGTNYQKINDFDIYGRPKRNGHDPFAIGK